MQTSPHPLSFAPIFMKDAHIPDSIAKSIFSIFLIFIFWPMADCIYNLPKIYWPIKKLFKSVQIYRRDADCSENDFLVHEFFFIRLLGFWDMVDVEGLDFMYAKY